jgi:L-alanine-DL-glutamate epimerase-like enolase superfamily enzyme
MATRLPRIQRLTVIPLIGATVDGGWPQGHEAQENLHTLIEIQADSGEVGVGSCFTSGALISGAVALLWPLLKGEAIEPERVSEKLRQSSFWQGRGGSVEHAISGIDIALWDLYGKLCQQPVSRLLGGNYRQRIRPYGSILFDEPEQLREHLQSVVARGFKAIKMGWRPFGRRGSRAFDEMLVRTARETVGPHIELMVDAGGSEQFWPHRLQWARETAKMLADYDIVWFEEPLAPDDLEGYIELTKVSPVPIAGGEVLTRRQAFQPWLERRAVDFIQPDSTKNGGLSESRRIAWMAYDHHVHFVSHGWNTAIGVAADLQLAAALPVAHYVEYLTPCAYIDDVTVEPFVLDGEGYLEIPDRPGLGVTLDEGKLARFRGKDSVTFGR